MNAQPHSIDTDDAKARLEDSRSELRALFEDEEPDSFPRSRTMQLLTRNKGAAAAAIVAGGWLLWRTGLVKRAIRMVPMGTVAKILANRLLRS